MVCREFCAARSSDGRVYRSINEERRSQPVRLRRSRRQFDEIEMFRAGNRAVQTLKLRFGRPVAPGVLAQECGRSFDRVS